VTFIPPLPSKDELQASSLFSSLTPSFGRSLNVNEYLLSSHCTSIEDCPLQDFDFSINLPSVRHPK